LLRVHCKTLVWLLNQQQPLTIKAMLHIRTVLARNHVNEQRDQVGPRSLVLHILARVRGIDWEGDFRGRNISERESQTPSLSPPSPIQVQLKRSVVFPDRH
jgi:hypothetical protein